MSLPTPIKFEPSPSVRALWLQLATPISVLIAALMISGAVMRLGSTPSSTPQGAQATATPAIRITDAVKLADDDPVIGKASAKVTIVEFSDFQCPYCRTFYNNTYKQLKKDYIDTGKVKLIFRDYPLPFHDGAKPAAMAAQCANDQGKYWQYHDKLFEEQDKKGTGTIAFTTDDLKLWAAQIGVSTATFNQCLDSEKYSAEVDADAQAGQEFGVEGTPSFFINGKLIVGAQAYSVFKAAIDAEL